MTLASYRPNILKLKVAVEKLWNDADVIPRQI